MIIYNSKQTMTCVPVIGYKYDVVVIHASALLVLISTFARRIISDLYRKGERLNRVN